MRKINRFPLGSHHWLEEIFADGPARDVQGRSRPTQRFLTLDHHGRLRIAEGGGASIARSLLETMRNAGVVSRFKLEPFTLTLKDHGVNATPDIVFQTSDHATYVAEVKSSRFLTADKLEKCQKVDAALAGSGMKYLLWTDTWPLPPSVWRLMREMRRLGFTDLPRSNLQDVVTAIAERPQTVLELREQRIDRSSILAAAWHGLVHFDFHAAFVDQTVISGNVHARRFSQTLTSTVKTHAWWGSLPQAAAIAAQVPSKNKSVRREVEHE